MHSFPCLSKIDGFCPAFDKRYVMDGIIEDGFLIFLSIASMGMKSL